MDGTFKPFLKWFLDISTWSILFRGRESLRVKDGLEVSGLRFKTTLRERVCVSFRGRDLLEESLMP